MYKLFNSFLYLLTYGHPQKFSVNLRELRACPGPSPSPDLTGFGSGSELGSAFLFFSGAGPRSKIFFVGPGSIFSFNQIHFDFSLKSKYNGAKVNV